MAFFAEISPYQRSYTVCIYTANPTYYQGRVWDPTELKPLRGLK